MRLVNLIGIGFWGFVVMLIGFVFILMEMGNFLSILSGWEIYLEMYFGNVIFEC